MSGTIFLLASLPTDQSTELLTVAPPTYRQYGTWLWYVMVPIITLLLVTEHVTTQIVAVPLLWIIPLPLEFIVLLAAILVGIIRIFVRELLLNQVWIPLALSCKITWLSGFIAIVVVTMVIQNVILLVDRSVYSMSVISMATSEWRRVR